MLLLKIVGGILALALGVWLGLPGRYDRGQSEIEKLLEQPGRRRRRAQRHFTPMDWFKRSKRSPDRIRRHRIRLASPDEDE